MVDPEKIARIGRQSIISAEQLDISDLGINDPLTHLYKFEQRGNDALVVIREDFDRDVGERLPRTPFVSDVEFEFTGSDFVSAKDRVSMKIMTENNLIILDAQQSTNAGLSEELTRAEVEATEVEKLSAWFKDAPVGTFLVFESLPIGKQKVAISRIYQKKDEDSLDSRFVSLYGPSVGVFNTFRNELGSSKSDCISELEILENDYEIRNPELTSIDQFVESYVATYDGVLNQQTGEEHSFGLNKDEKAAQKNGLSIVRSHPKLTSIYVDAIKSLAEGQDRVSDDLVHINDRLGLGFGLHEGDAITIQTKRRVLQEVIRGVTSAIDRADVDLLFDIERSDSSSGMGYAAVSHYGSESRSEGASYESNACPEYSFANQSGAIGGTNGSEYNTLFGAFNPMNIPNKFGRPKIGICRINNCPTRGKSRYVHGNTLVGGCDICVHCHQIFEKGKSPEIVYDEKIKDEQRKQKQDEEESARLENERIEWEKRKATRNKQKLMRETKRSEIPKQKSFFQQLEEIGKKAA